MPCFSSIVNYSVSYLLTFTQVAYEPLSHTPFFKFPTTYYIVMKIAQHGQHSKLEGIEIEQFARRILIAFYRFE